VLSPGSHVSGQEGHVLDDTKEIDRPPLPGKCITATKDTRTAEIRKEGVDDNLRESIKWSLNVDSEFAEGKGEGKDEMLGNVIDVKRKKREGEGSIINFESSNLVIHKPRERAEGGKADATPIQQTITNEEAKGTAANNPQRFGGGIGISRSL